MQLLWPTSLWLLLAVPALLLWYVLAQRRRRRYALRYASLSLVKEALGRGPGLRRHVPPALFLVGLAAMLFAAARPVAVIALPQQEGTVILAIDVSGSMRAEDLQPNRLEAAKAAAKTFVERQQDQTTRVGVVSFATDASIVQPPTTDRAATIDAIERLRPQRATAIGKAILASLEAIFEAQDDDAPATRSPAPRGAPTPRPTPTPTPVPKGVFAPAMIVLLSDGQNNQFPPPLAVVDQATNRGIRVFTIGVGSVEGTILRIEGRAIRTRLDEDTLKKIAEVTDGEYFHASDENALKEIYEKLTRQVTLRFEKTEVTALFTVLGAVLALVAGMLSLAWFGRLP